ncbi:MAG: AtpZ/AtpI family protein [Sphingomicrobium sp.]
MAAKEPGQDPSSPQDARLDSLEERLARAQHEETKRTGKGPAPDANEQLGNRVLSTLIGGLVGGALIGWVLDKLFDTGHLLLIVFLVLGTVGGFWSIIKLSSRSPGASGPS